MADTIGAFKLHNSGGFACAGKVTYQNGGSRVTTDAESGTLLLGQEGEVNPGSLGVPNGSSVWLHVDVKAGSDAEAAQAFLYDAVSTKRARYVISGTTWDNQLGLIDVEG